MVTERITVSIPQYGCGQFIHRAVVSLLSQTYSNLLVVVVNDADRNFNWEQLSDIDDRRLVRFDLVANHGRYFADQVVLKATPDKYLLIQDADDWSEPRRVEKLFAQINKDYSNGALSTVRMYATSDYPIPVSYINWLPERNNTPGEKLINRLGHYGLFKINSLEDIGGYYGGFRIVYDRLIMNLLLMTGKISFVDEPLYNYCRRHGSLTLGSDTDMGSNTRQVVVGELQLEYDHIYYSYLNYTSNRIKREEFLDAIKQCVNEHISKESRTELDREAKRLQQKLRNIKYFEP